MNPTLAIIPGMAGWSELLLILALALILFGPKRLPEIAEAMGKSIRKFKSATRDATDEVKREIDEAKQGLDGDSGIDSGNDSGIDSGIDSGNDSGNDSGSGHKQD